MLHPATGQRFRIDRPLGFLVVADHAEMLQLQYRPAQRDPEFDPDRPAFYYLRVMEIETPRHQVYDAVALRMDPRATGYPVTIQERAHSSPIWYTPGH